MKSLFSLIVLFLYFLHGLKAISVLTKHHIYISIMIFHKTLHCLWYFIANLVILISEIKRFSLVRVFIGILNPMFLEPLFIVVNFNGGYEKGILLCLMLHGKTVTHIIMWWGMRGFIATMTPIITRLIWTFNIIGNDTLNYWM